MSERLVAQIWSNQQVIEERLFTRDGAKVKVVYPGRLNSDSGPDFRDAIIAIGGELMKGDIEVHVRSGDWRAHGHDTDGCYNGVLLHVVMWDDAETRTPLQNGKWAPTLALHCCLDGPLDQVRRRVPSEPCRGAGERLDAAAIGQLLDEAGEARFRLKAAVFEAELANEEGAQVLYEGIMGAWATPRIRSPFRSWPEGCHWVFWRGLPRENHKG